MNMQYLVDSLQNERVLNGGVRWAREEEMRQVTHEQTLSNPKSVFKGGLPVISDGDTVRVSAEDEHSLIIGSTGSKKTRLFCMPMLELFCRAGESVIVTDPKGELYNLMAGTFRKRGYRIRVINLRDPQRSHGWNPLAQSRRYRKKGNCERAAHCVNDFAQAMIPENSSGHSDKFWDNSARNILRGLSGLVVDGYRHIPDEAVNLATLRNFSSQLYKEEYYSGTSTFELLPYYPEDSIGRYNLESIKNAPDKTFDSIRVSYDVPMQQLYLQRSLVNLLSTDDVDFEELGLYKCVLFLILPDEKTSMHKIASLIIKQCYERLIETAHEQPGNTLPIRVNFLLDEFSNLPAIEDFSAMISAARSRNIKFHLIIQGLQQLTAKYGPNDAQTILGNCANWAFLTSRELTLLEQISALCGIDSFTGERLISVSQLQRLNKEKGEVLMLIGRQFPFIAHLPDISQYVLTKAEPEPLPRMNPKRITGVTVEEVLRSMKKETLSSARKKKTSTSDDQMSPATQAALEAKFDELFNLIDDADDE